MQEAFGTRALFLAGYGAADFGECARAVQHAVPGDAGSWHDAWSGIAGGLVADADASAAGGHRVSAREAYLRATTYYRTAYAPLFGSPVDPRLQAAFARAEEAFAKAAPLWDMPVELLEIPFENGSLPAVFVAADGSAHPRPTIVHVNGYDSNVHEMFAAHVPAAIARGYNILLFDGPGQGRNLIRDGLPMRPDWEHVVRPVIDAVLERPEVDAERVVLAGWSFGGFLAPRAAAFEDRIAALWADPGQWDQRDAFIDMLPLSDEEKAHFPDIDPEKLAPMEAHLRSPDADPMLRWRFIDRSFWVNGVDSVYGYFAEMTRYEVSSVAAGIRCPTLLTVAEGDPSAVGTPKLLDAIGARCKTLVRFTEGDGAGGHCEGMARRLFHQRCYDWLDETIA